MTIIDTRPDASLFSTECHRGEGGQSKLPLNHAGKC